MLANGNASAARPQANLIELSLNLIKFLNFQAIIIISVELDLPAMPNGGARDASQALQGTGSLPQGESIGEVAADASVGIPSISPSKVPRKTDRQNS
jgi:hypothetical protein